MSSFASGGIGTSASETAPPSATSESLIGNAAQDTSQFKTTTPAIGQPTSSTMSSFASGGIGASASETAPPSATSESLIGNAAQDTSQFKTTTPAIGQPTPSTMSSFGEEPSGGIGASASETAPPSTTSESLIWNAAQDTSQFKMTTPAFGQPAPSTLSSFASRGIGASASETAPPSTTSGSLIGNVAQDMSQFKTTTPAILQPTPSTMSSFASGGLGASASGAPSTSGSLYGNAAQYTDPFKTTTPALPAHRLRRVIRRHPATPTKSGASGFGASQTSMSVFCASTPQQASGTGMFGATSTACCQLLPQFGLFGATATPTGGGLFGQPQSTGLFGQTATPTARSGLFVGVGLAGWGTIRKFKALTGTEFTTKDWEPITINFSLQCITCMKEYENKSLEELRLEDYAANRKGGQAGMVGFGATTQQSSIFSAPVSKRSAFNFGTNQNKSLFGTSNTSMFTSTGSSIFGQNTQTQNVFGKTTGFGLPAQPTSTAFGMSTAFGTGTSVFGQPQQKSLFGQPVATGLFGQTAATTQASTGFGTSFGPTFGATTQANAFGVKQPFGVATTSAPSAFSFGSTANTGMSLFGAKQPAFSFQSTAPTPFGTGTTGFGGFATTPATGTGLFGAPKSTLSFGTGMTPAFGATGFGTTGFGATPLGTASTGTGLFGASTAAKPTGFGFGTGTTGTSFAFGASPATSGTTIKFKALTGTDTMMKNGMSCTINTSHQFITCMKEYENKSLEELRLEDYAANRKGGQAGMVGFGATTQQISIFSAPVSQQSAFNFGASQNKSLFGTSNTGTFPLTGGSIFGQNTQTKTTGFGLPAQPFSPAFSTGMAFGTGSSVLGQTQQKLLFGQPAATGLFGQTATTTQPRASTGFGTDFGAATQANAFGGKPPLGVTELYKTKVVCVKCSAEIQGREQPIHCSGTCQGAYHRKCVNVGPTESEILMQGGSGAFKCPTCTCRSAEDGRPLPHSSGECTVSSGAIAGENESDRASTSETSKDENVQTTNDLVQQLLSMVDNLTNEVGCLKMECQTLRQQLGVTGTGSSALDRAD